VRIPVLDLARQHAGLRRELERALSRVLDSGQFTLGPEVDEFERELAKHLGVGHVIAMSSGTDALLVSLMALGVGMGDEVVTTPFTFFATAAVVHRLGARIVFCDIEPGGFGIAPSALEAALTGRTRAVVPVHLYGQCAEMDPILEACGERGVAVVEDAAQAVGATYKGRPAGGMGKAGALSFYPTKNLGGLGDGGAVLTNDADLAERVRRLRVHGAPKTYVHEEVGINGRMDAFQAACLRVKLRHLDEWNEARRACAGRYDRLFGEAGLALEYDTPGLDAKLALPKELPGRTHVFHQYVVRAPGREELGRHLAESGVGSAVFYPLPLHLQPCFSYLGYGEGDFPEAERAAREVLALPMYPGLMEPDQAEVVAAVRTFYEKDGRR
jgi:dTDP-4-amino-4,6-dideoxygalactose transaminase